MPSPLKQKGHKKYGGAVKGMKYKKTILKEKARESFELAQLKKWEKISDAQAKDAITNWKARQYTINQVIGEPTKSVEISNPEGKAFKIQAIIKESLQKIYGENKQ